MNIQSIIDLHISGTIVARCFEITGVVVAGILIVVIALCLFTFSKSVFLYWKYKRVLKKKYPAHATDCMTIHAHHQKQSMNFRKMLKNTLNWQDTTDNWARASRWSWFWKYFLFGWLFDKYDVTFIPINKELETGESTVIPKDLIADLIRSSAHRVIVPLCMCRVGCTCIDYPMGIGCIFLGEATRLMDPTHGRPASIEQALDHLNKAVEAGLIPQIGKVDPDANWSGIKMENWDKFLTLCFCCTCCCIAMRNTDRWSDEVKNKMHRLEGLSIKVTHGCIGCGKCTDQCFARAIRIEDKKAAINDTLCKGCGLCVEKCPQKAIEIKISDPNKMVDELHRRIRSYGSI